jgi:NADH:ubiquinone oxidoreductase subunit 2 (subunit N)
MVVMYMREPRHAVPVDRVPPALGLALGLSLALTLYLGVYPGQVLEYAGRSVAELR